MTKIDLKFYDYEVNSWQAMLQMLVHYVSLGYTHYVKIEIAEKKMYKVKEIDLKMIEKYNTHFGKDKKYRNKKKGIANFVYLRFENQAFVLMATKKFEGKNTLSDCVIDDDFVVFKDKNSPMTFDVSKNLSLRIGLNEEKKATVFLTKETLRNKKAMMFELIEQKKLNQAISEFNKLNGIPAWSGINKQKLQLKQQLLNKLKKHRFSHEKQKDFNQKTYINFTRQPVKVF